MLPGDISFFDSFSGVMYEPVDFLFGPVWFCFCGGCALNLTGFRCICFPVLGPFLFVTCLGLIVLPWWGFTISVSCPFFVLEPEEDWFSVAWAFPCEPPAFVTPTM